MGRRRLAECDASRELSPDRFVINHPGKRKIAPFKTNVGTIGRVLRVLIGLGTCAKKADPES